MPYNRDKDEYYWGYNPNPDGSNIDMTKPSPKLSDAYRVLKNHAKPDDELQMVIVGKIHYSTSNEHGIGGATFNVNMGSLEATATGIGLRGKAVTHGGGGFSLEEKISQLVGLNYIPEKITGIYFRILN